MVMPTPLREVDVYELPGLDAEAASTLAERIWHAICATRNSAPRAGRMKHFGAY